MRFIRTYRKEKLPRGYSYPLGAEAISTALEGVPQFDSIDLWFRWRDEFWASRWRRRVLNHGVVSLLDMSWYEYFGRWHLTVYSVPSEYAQPAREHLERELPRVYQQLA